MKPIRIPIEDTLDLHTFQPADVTHLLQDYLDECARAGIFSIRVIHGKGSGILKSRVQSLLKDHPRVMRFNDAPPEAGGWGATIVELRK